MQRDEYAIGKALDELNPKLAAGPDSDTLRLLASLTIEAAELQWSWYDTWENVYLWLSNSVRLAGTILLAIAVLVPLLLAIPGSQSIPTAGNDTNRLWWLSIGYASAALAGLLLSVDRFFLLTESWGRFSLMTTTLASKVSVFRYDCQKSFVDFGTGTIPADKAKQFIESCKQFLQEVNNDVITETKEWRTTLNEAVKALAERVGKATEESQRRFEEAQKSASTGDLMVRISGVQRGHGDIEVFVDAKSRGTLSDPNWELLVDDLSPGGHAIKLVLNTQDNRPYELRRKILVKGGESAIFEFPATEVWKKGTLRVRLKGGTQSFGNVQVKVKEAAFEYTFQDPNWQADFIDMPSGNITVSVSGTAPNGRTISRTEQVQLPAGQIKEWEFQLPT
jgi:hypothetical protein